MRAEGRDVVDVELGKRLVDALREPARVEEFAKREGGGGEAAGHADAGAGKLADHLAERRVLAADALDIGHAQAIEPDHPLLLVHLPAPCPMRTRRRRRTIPRQRR